MQTALGPKTSTIGLAFKERAKEKDSTTFPSPLPFRPFCQKKLVAERPGKEMRGVISPEDLLYVGLRDLADRPNANRISSLWVFLRPLDLKDFPIGFSLCGLF